MTLHTENTVEFGDTADLTHASPAALAPRIVRAGEGRAYSYLGPGVTGTCVVDAASTGSAYSVFECLVQPGAGIPPHVHDNEDETFYVREGIFEIQRASELYTLEAGMSVYGPRQVPHAFRNIGDAPARLFVVVTPGGFEHFFAALEAGQEVFGDLSTDQARMQFGQLLAQWGMQPVMGMSEPVPMGHPAQPPMSDVGNHRGRLMVSAEDTGGAMLFGDTEVDPQGGVPPHIHHAEDEGFYVLSGQFELMIGDLLTVIGPGDFAFGARHVPHCWRNIGESRAYLLGIVTPGANMQAFAQEMQQFIAEAGGQALTEMTDPSLMQRMGALFQAHAIEPYVPAAIK